MTHSPLFRKLMKKIIDTSGLLWSLTFYIQFIEYFTNRFKCGDACRY